MSTLAELKAKIASDLHRSDKSSEIGEAIDSAIRHYGREGFWFLEDTYTFTTSATNTYSMPTDFISPFTFKALVSGSEYPIDLVDYATIDEKDSGIITGTPDEIAIYNDNFRLYPKSNGDYPITVHYRKSLDAPSEGGSNAWTTHGFDLIRYRAEWDLYANDLRNPEQAAISKNSESEAFLSLLSMNTKRQATGTLKKSGW